MNSIKHKCKWLIGLLIIFGVPAIMAQDYHFPREQWHRQEFLGFGCRFCPLPSELWKWKSEVSQFLLEGKAWDAIPLLQRIVFCDPHDFLSYEALSYAYALIGDVFAARNTDLLIVALFEGIPHPYAYWTVEYAKWRLFRFDPLGWRMRVEALRRLYRGAIWCRHPAPVYLYISLPFVCINNFADAAGVSIRKERLEKVAMQIQKELDNASEREHFIKYWQKKQDDSDEHFSKCSICKRVKGIIAKK